MAQLVEIKVVYVSARLVGIKMVYVQSPHAADPVCFTDGMDRSVRSGLVLQHRAPLGQSECSIRNSGEMVVWTLYNSA